MKSRFAILILFLSFMALGWAIGSSPPADDNVAIAPQLFSGLQYRMIGPSRGGRVTAVAGHREQPATFYMGATGGGVWKTTDYGHNWHPVSDGYFATGSIGAIAVAESDFNVVYVGTGSDGIRSNVIIGKGMYKSLDGGQTWTHIGLEKAGAIGAVLVDPTDANRVWVAAIGNPFAPNPERGVYRSADGGTSWELVLFRSDKTGAVDLEFAPDNPSEIYASFWTVDRKPWTIISGGGEDGIYKSNDGGDSWKKLAVGLPTGLVGKSDLAVSAAAPNRAYALIEAPGQQGGVYRSDNRGESWTLVSNFQPIRNRPFYYTNLVAHPKDPDVLWGMAEGYYKSEDAGRTWSRRSVPHGDNHDMWINPDHPDTFIQSNDGGANVTLDGGETWSTQHNQPTAELYQVDISDDFPYRLYAGQQDNSTISVPSFPPRSMPGGHTAYWESIGGCETGPAVPKPGDPDIVYADCKGRFGLYNRRTGQEKQYYVGFWNIYGHNPKDLAYRFQRVAPIHVSPHNPNRVYHTSQFVHVTENGGETWETISPDLTAFTPETQVVSGGPITIDVTGEEHFSTIYEIQESPHEVGVIWVGSNDGPIHVTRDGGKNWRNVTPPGIGPYGRVQNIEVSPHRPASAYATILRYQLGDFAPYVFKTENYGESWTRLTSGDNGIPGDYPVRVVREDPDREGLLYAGTEFGMFISFDNGARWQSFQLDLPVTPVSDLKVVHKDLVLSTMGRGFWILSDLTPLHSVSAEMVNRKKLFPVRNPYRLRGGPRSGGGRSPAEPDYPPPGASIDYYIPEGDNEEIRLEILDSRGHLVRSFSSQAGGEKSVLPREASMREWRLERVGTPRLPAGPGMHRFVWDLTHAGPWHEDQSRSGRGGPMVPPGIYTAKLTIGSWSEEEKFEALLDPRVTAEGVTAEQINLQVDLALKARDALSRARAAVVEIDEAMEEVTEDRREQLEKLHASLVTEPVRYSQPMLVDQLSYLFGNLDQADQRPGDFALKRYDELKSALDDIVASLEQILGLR